MFNICVNWTGACVRCITPLWQQELKCCFQTNGLAESHKCCTGRSLCNTTLLSRGRSVLQVCALSTYWRHKVSWLYPRGCPIVINCVSLRHRLGPQQRQHKRHWNDCFSNGSLYLSVCLCVCVFCAFLYRYCEEKMRRRMCELWRIFRLVSVVCRYASRWKGPVCLSVSLCMSVCMSASVSLCLSLCLSVPLYVSLSLCLSLCRSVSMSIFLCSLLLCVCVCLHPSTQLNFLVYQSEVPYLTFLNIPQTVHIIIILK